MSVIGALSEWADFIDSKVPEILNLVVDTWATLPPPAPDDLEDHISNRLCAALQQNRTVREMMFYVLPQMVILEAGAGEELGRTDIAFLPTGLSLVPREDIYFCLECKRLNVIKNGHKRTYASEYVMYGMLRFVVGQYSSSVRHGGMVGYVLDGDIEGAVKNVEVNVRAKYLELRMDAPGVLTAATKLPADLGNRESQHHRTVGQVDFTIHHMFVARSVGIAIAASAVNANVVSEVTQTNNPARG